MKTIQRPLTGTSQLSRQYRRVALVIVTASTLIYLAGCAAEPLNATPARTVPTIEAATQVYIYPAKAQSGAQLDRDRYECHQWAVQQTHLDPSATTGNRLPGTVESTPAPGVNTATGAIAGAVLGGVIGGPHDTAAGILAGAITGAAIGAGANSSQQRAAAQQQNARRYQRQLAQAQDYRHALSACLEGRGYTVK